MTPCLMGITAHLCTGMKLKCSKKLFNYKTIHLLYFMNEWCVFCAVFPQNVEYLSFHTDSQNATLESADDPRCATHRFLK